MKNKAVIIILLILNTLYLIPDTVYADYVLPYPSYMPGNKLYRVSRIADTLKQYWYFGSIASFRYHLELADKYLVEAKTLFEYKQYVLAIDALKRSDREIVVLPLWIAKAKSEGKDASGLVEKGQNATLKHQEMLNMLIGILPEEYLWEPEKAQAIPLAIKSHLLEAAALREETRNKILGTNSL